MMGMWFFAKNDTSNTEGMLWVNQEFDCNSHVLSKELPENLEDVRLSQQPRNGDPNLTNFSPPTDGVTIPLNCNFVVTKKDDGIVSP